MCIFGIANATQKRVETLGQCEMKCENNNKVSH